MKNKIGLIGVTAELYKKKLPDLVKNLSKFSEKVEKILEKFSEVVCVPLVYTEKQMEDAFKKMKEKDVAGIILVFLSYSPSLIISPVLKKNKNIPVLIWNTQSLLSIDKNFKNSDMFYNHGMHGVQDLTSVLLRERIKFYLITGHYKDKKIISKIEKWCKAASVAKILENSRIARVGGRFKDMGDFSVDDKKITEYLGPEILDIPLTKIAAESKKIKNIEIKKSMANDHKKFKISSDLTEKVHFISTRLELSLRRLIAKERLSGLAINFMGFKGDKGAETIPFMAIGKFLAEGMGYGGEGDVLCATSVLILQKLAGTANFVEMFTTDYKNKRILFSHMGESNPKMAKNKNLIRLVKKDLSLTGPNLFTAMFLFPLKAGKITLFNIASGEDGKFKFIVANGEILDEPLLKDINSPHFLMKVPDVEDFLTKYSLLGGTHHLAMAYGDKKIELKYLAEIMKLPFFEI